MKAIVLGGAGVMGSHAAQVLLGTTTFSHVYIADQVKPTWTFGKTVAKPLYVPVDVTDEKSLNNALAKADVAINCTGPFYKFAAPILKAAIENGVHYVDICDDYDTTQVLIDTLHKKARTRGITCIVGLGASPGLTNIIASYATQLLSQVSDICIYVTRGIKEEAGAAIPYHMLHCWLGNVPIYQDGTYHMARALIDGEEHVDFPQPFGRAPVYYFGHPETVTLPRYIKGIKNVCCKGTFIPPEFRQALLHLQSLGFLDTHPVMVNGESILPLDFTAAYIPSLIKNISTQATHVPQGGAVMVKVTGNDDSGPKTYQFSGTSHMREGTATPAAVGADMIAQENIHSPGVQAPEACVSPEQFINQLIKPGIIGDSWLTVTQKITGPL